MSEVNWKSASEVLRLELFHMAQDGEITYKHAFLKMVEHMNYLDEKEIIQWI